MRIHLLAAAVFLGVIGLAPVSHAADLPAGHPPVGAPAAAPVAPIPSHSGTVTETIPVPSYVYVHVKGAEGEEWLAAPSAEVKVGAKVNWNDGLVMKGFVSKTLNRTFDSIRFVEILEVAK